MLKVDGVKAKITEKTEANQPKGNEKGLLLSWSHLETSSDFFGFERKYQPRADIATIVPAITAMFWFWSVETPAVEEPDGDPAGFTSVASGVSEAGSSPGLAPYKCPSWVVVQKCKN